MGGRRPHRVWEVFVAGRTVYEGHFKRDRKQHGIDTLRHREGATSQLWENGAPPPEPAANTACEGYGLVNSIITVLSAPSWVLMRRILQ